MPTRKFITAIPLILAFSVTLAGCQKPNQESREDVLKKRVAETLTDPLSAQFRNTKLSPDQKFLCGEINAKNKMGGYVGFRPFAVSDDFDYIVDENYIGLKFMLAEPAKAAENFLMKNIRQSGCFA